MLPGGAKHQKNTAKVLGSCGTKAIIENSNFRFKMFSNIFLGIPY